MTTDARARTRALQALLTGAEDGSVGQELAWFLVDRLRGSETAPPVLDGERLAEAHAYTDEHRVRTITNRLLPGAGGEVIAALAGAVALERRLIETVATLEDADIEVLVLKGSATAHLDHATPSDREVGDVDVLVRPERLDDAIAALDRIGGRVKVTHPFRDPLFFHSETVLHPDGTEIDLHTRLAQPSRTPRSCWTSPDTFVVGGRTCAAMPADWRFLHALVHQVMNPPPSFRGLNGLLDLIVMAPRVDIDGVRRAADEIGLRAVAERGLARLGGVLDRPITPDPDWSPGRLDDRTAQAFDGNHPVPGYLSLAANLAVLPTRRWPAFLGGLLWPSREYRSELGVSPTSQLRHVVREALGR